VNGFVKRFKEWVYEREQSLSSGYITNTSNMQGDRDDGLNTCDNINELLHDTFKNVAEGFDEEQRARDRLNEKALQVGGGW